MCPSNYVLTITSGFIAAKVPGAAKAAEAAADVKDGQNGRRSGSGKRRDWSEQRKAAKEPAYGGATSGRRRSAASKRMRGDRDQTGDAGVKPGRKRDRAISRGSRASNSDAPAATNATMSSRNRIRNCVWYAHRQ